MYDVFLSSECYIKREQTIPPTVILFANNKGLVW